MLLFQHFGHLLSGRIPKNRSSKLVQVQRFLLVQQLALVQRFLLVPQLDLAQRFLLDQQLALDRT